MTAENERYVRNRHIGRIIGMSTLILFLIIYIIVRHRTGVRLKKAHNALQTAYDQLEETTTAKERMESELRIARDIVEALKADTDRFRDGAEPNDDLTLLAFSFTS